MTHREGVKRTWEEGGRLRRGESEFTALHLALHDEAVEIVQHRGAIKEGQLPFPRFSQHRQQFFMQAAEKLGAALQRDARAAKHIAAQYRQGTLMDRRLIVVDTGHQQAQRAVDHRLLLITQHIEHFAHNAQTGAGRTNCRAADETLNKVLRLPQFLFRQHTQEATQIGRDDIGDLILSALQFAHQVNGDLVDVVFCQVSRDLQQMFAGRLAHRQMLADRKHVGQMHCRVQRRFGLRLYVVAQHINMRQLHRPVNGGLQITQIDTGSAVLIQHIVTLTHCALPQVFHQSPVLTIRCIKRTDNGNNFTGKLGVRIHFFKAAQHTQAQRRIAVAQHCAQRLHRFADLTIGNVGIGQRSQRIHQHKAVGSACSIEMLEQRHNELGRFLLFAAGKEGLAHRLQTIGNALGVAVGNLMVGMQTLFNIVIPKLHRLIQHRRHRRIHHVTAGAHRALLAVFQPAVGQNATHDLSRNAAHVAVCMHQQLIQQAQRLLLIGHRHIVAVLFQQAQICADPLQIFLALSLLQQQFKGLRGADHLHQLHRAVQRHMPQRLQSLVCRQQRIVAVLHCFQLILIQLQRHANAFQQALKITQLIVDRLIALLFLRCDIRQLGENALICFSQRADTDHFPAVRATLTADTEIGIDQQQRLNRQVLKLQIPSGVVGGNIADILHTVVNEPLPRIVVVQVRHAALIVTAAAEFTDIVSESCGADQRKIHRKTGFRRHNGRMQRNIVDTDGVRLQIEGTQLAAQAQQRQNVRLLHSLCEGLILPCHAAAAQRRLVKAQQNAQRIGAFRIPLHRFFQHAQVNRLVSAQFCTAMHRIGEQIIDQPIAQLRKPYRMVKRRLLHHRGAKRQHLSAQITIVTGKALQSRHRLTVTQQTRRHCYRILAQNTAQRFIYVHLLTHTAPRR